MARSAESYHSLPLLPIRFRFIGYAMISLSLGAAYLYLLGGRPAAFETPVVAFVTSYAETRWFVIAQTNALDELAVVFAVLGSLFILFSKEKVENEEIENLRVRSLFQSVYYTSGLIIMFYLFVFGWPVFILISFSFLLFLIISITSFKIYLYRFTKTESKKKPRRVMKRLRFIGIAGLVMLFVLSSCGILDGDSGSSGTEPIGGDPSPMAAVGNEFSLYAAGLGVSESNAKVTHQSDDIATITASAKVTDPMMKSIMEVVPTFEMESQGSDVYSGTIKIRLTSKGIQDIYDDGSPFTLINYGAKNGDTYKKEVNGRTITRKVTKVSKDDDYEYGFIFIKVVEVEETGNGIPGVSKIKYFGNHRFGLVGMEIFFEDGSSKRATVISDNFNE